MSIALTAATAPVPFVAAPIAPPIRGADISSTLRQESAGTTVTADGAQMEVEQVLAAAGANYVRLRIWVDPPAGHSDEASALILARRARAAGLKVLINLHYSDSWADPENQAIPAAWQGQDLATLAETVRGYTQRVVSDFAAQGTPVDMVQIGNEITWGMLWPVGAVYLEHGERWQAMATLLNAGIAGVRAATPVGHSTAVMLHSERSGDAQGARHFYDSVITAGVTDFDVIGLSYYPFWHGSLATLQATLNDLAVRYEDRDLLIAETAYPWTPGPAAGLLHAVDPSALPDGAAFPPTESGQAAYFAALRAVIARVPHGRCKGFLVWEPGWLSPGGDEPDLVPTNLNLAMFDTQGRALPSVDTAFTGNGAVS